MIDSVYIIKRGETTLNEGWSFLYGLRNKIIVDLI